MAISFPSASRASTIGWRTPAVIVVCGCFISMISFGPRATLGFFLTPMSQANDWGRDVFGLALAIQNILWGSANRLPAPSPTVTAPCACCGPAARFTRSA